MALLLYQFRNSIFLIGSTMSRLCVIIVASWLMHGRRWDKRRTFRHQLSIDFLTCSPGASHMRSCQILTPKLRSLHVVLCLCLLRYSAKLLFRLLSFIAHTSLQSPAWWRLFRLERNNYVFIWNWCFGSIFLGSRKGVVARALDLRPWRLWVRLQGLCFWGNKLFTHMCLCHQAV